MPEDLRLLCRVIDDSSMADQDRWPPFTEIEGEAASRYPWRQLFDCLVTHLDSAPANFRDLMMEATQRL